MQQDISVSDELEVEKGTSFLDFEEDRMLKVIDENSAKKYINSQYSQNEDNIVIIPQSIWDSEDGLTDTELTINSVEMI